MRAAICYEFGQPLVVEEVQITSPGDNQVLVKVAATGVCHSDIHCIRGEFPHDLPVIPGHETAGYVVEIGKKVRRVKPKDAVVVTSLQSCGQCSLCRAGLPHLCEKESTLGKPKIRSHKGQDIAPMAKVGGFAEFVVVHESQVVAIPNDISMDCAAVISCAVITGFGAVVNRARVRPFSSVVVIGVGGVGLNVVQGAAFVGARPIIAIDLTDVKLKFARELGATHTINARSEDALERVRSLTSGKGADYVFVAVGSTTAMRQGFFMSAPRGKVVLIGVPPVNQSLTFSGIELITQFTRVERELLGSFMGSTKLEQDIPRLVELYQSGKLKLRELITARYPLEQINEAIAAVERAEVLRNVIIFE